jgi:hypothetical protein
VPYILFTALVVLGVAVLDVVVVVVGRRWL